MCSYSLSPPAVATAVRAHPRAAARARARAASTTPRCRSPGRRRAARSRSCRTRASSTSTRALAYFQLDYQVVFARPARALLLQAAGLDQSDPRPRRRSPRQVSSRRQDGDGQDQARDQVRHREAELDQRQGGHVRRRRSTRSSADTTRTWPTAIWASTSRLTAPAAPRAARSPGITTPDKYTIVLQLTKNFGATTGQGARDADHDAGAEVLRGAVRRQEPERLRRRSDAAGVHRAVHDLRVLAGQEPHAHPQPGVERLAPTRGRPTSTRSSGRWATDPNVSRAARSSPARSMVNGDTPAAPIVKQFATQKPGADLVHAARQPVGQPQLSQRSRSRTSTSARRRRRSSIAPRCSGCAAARSSATSPRTSCRRASWLRPGRRHEGPGRRLPRQPERKSPARRVLHEEGGLRERQGPRHAAPARRQTTTRRRRRTR